MEEMALDPLMVMVEMSSNVLLFHRLTHSDPLREQYTI